MPEVSSKILPNYSDRSLASLRYSKLIEATLRAAIAGVDHNQIESNDIKLPGVMLAALATDDLETARDILQRYDSVNRLPRFLDRGGHTRGVYEGIATLALFECYRRFDLHAPFAPEVRLPEQIFDGDAASHVARAALIAAATNDAASIHSILEKQHAGGSFLTLGSSDNPEPAWYHDLAILHAITTYACSTRDPIALSAVHRGAVYVTHEVQPDHASAQPWAVHAMLLYDESLPLADILLHAAGVQSPTTLDGVSILLLADALIALNKIK